MDDIKRQEILNYLQANEFFKTIKDVEKKLDAWIDAYPIDILTELKRLNAYLVTSSARYSDYGRFINNNLNRASGPPAMRPASVNEILSKIAKALDMNKDLKPRKINEQARLQELKDQLERRKKENPGGNYGGA